MKALFVELPAFERNRSSYLTDEAYRGLQNEMLKDPELASGQYDIAIGEVLIGVKLVLIVLKRRWNITHYPCDIVGIII